jgi:hypothetical protein
MPKNTKPSTKRLVEPQAMSSVELAPELEVVPQTEAQIEPLAEPEAPTQPMGNIRGD